MNDKLKEGLYVLSSDGDRMGKIDNVYLGLPESKIKY
jgi:uncharacterized protein YrrD